MTIRTKDKGAPLSPAASLNTMKHQQLQSEMALSQQGECQRVRKQVGVIKAVKRDFICKRLSHVGWMFLSSGAGGSLSITTLTSGSLMFICLQQPDKVPAH